MKTDGAFDAEEYPPNPTFQDLIDVIRHLQSAGEHQRASLSRTLHDDLGGLLVSAVMDLGWIEQHRTTADFSERLHRVRGALAAAIDLKRNLIEDLRPSLLDNFGLFAAYRWHVKHRCKSEGVVCTEVYPDEELGLRPDALAGLFRTMQEILAVIFAEHSIERLDVIVTIDRETLLLKTDHTHTTEETTDVFRQLPLQMYSILQRIGALGGSLRISRRSSGTALSARFPMERLLIPASVVQPS